MARANLGISEFAVSRAIVELGGAQNPISYEQIAAHIGCEKQAVWRAIRKLAAAGKVKRLDGSKRTGGYRYYVEY